MTSQTLELSLRQQRDAGRKLLIPYITGGLGSDWVATLEAVAAAGADAVEVGLPFSDPMMDGPIIQAASVRALAGGATAQGIIAEIATADVAVPVAVMTYYNIVARTGHRRMARLLADAGILGAIVPDLPVDELDGWGVEADDAGVATVLLAAPTTPAERLREIVARGRGFLYAVGLMGVTGERADLATSAAEIAARCKAVTDLPVLVGVGISTPAQAAEVSRVADGVVVGSAFVHRILDGCGPDGAAALVKEFRAALDA
ncbi:MAG: tryptophan synthase subunit alpha [Acidimicrobiales bacterium]|jgi:tryptophan synthase alpha chain